MKMNSVWLDSLKTIDEALERARKLTKPAIHGGLKDLDESLQAAQESLKWLKAYPSTMLPHFVAVTQDHRRRGGFQEQDLDKMAVLDMAWAKEYLDTFKRGFADLRRISR